ncbi:MAG TPA: hypothetical protein VE912_19720, partial [Bacteroidales bacterium]|nr:hypothetical protein [Bacteroidales bacterium]
PTMKQVPEFGGRIQIPVPKGEAALSYHHRVADSRNILNNELQFSDIPENRIGFDTKLDLVIGCWLEASWTNKEKNVGIYTNQEIMNVGMDYTFGIGNGLTVTFEQLLAAYDKKPFELNQSVSFSLLSISYPVGIFDNINAIIYYDWTHQAAYNFVNWQKQFNNVSLYLMAYINPTTYQIPTQGDVDNFYAGKGIQFMFVYNH